MFVFRFVRPVLLVLVSGHLVSRVCRTRLERKVICLRSDALKADRIFQIVKKTVRREGNHKS